MVTILDEVRSEQLEAGRGAEHAGGTKIRWSRRERLEVLAGAGLAQLANPDLSDLEAARLGQQRLPEDRRRPIPSITTPPWEWFRVGLPAARQWAGEEPREPQEPREAQPPAATPDVVRDGPECPPPDTEPAPELRPAPVATELLDALARGHNDQLALLARVEQLEATLQSALGRLEGLLRGGFTLIPAGATPGPRPGVVPPEALPVPVPAPPAPAPPAPAPAPPAPVTRKPRVVVLSVTSGHTKRGIKYGSHGHLARLELWDAPLKSANFAGFDYVVTTKWTPIHWVKKAKTENYSSKLRHAPGNAEQIAGFLKTLPEIPLE